MALSDIAPPSRPPPFLIQSQLEYLALQGHLHIQLPAYLAQQCADLTKQSLDFFELPSQQKKTIYPAAHGTELGYYSVPEEKEYITLRHGTQSTSKFDVVSSTLEKSVQIFWQQSAALLRRILADLAEYVGGQSSEWDPVLDEEGTSIIPCDWGSAGPTLLRLFKYSATTGIAEEHTDMGLLTLCVGCGDGLQVWERFNERTQTNSGTSNLPTGQWINAEGPTILVGSFASIMTNRKARAGLHRVVGNPQGRTSIVFALRPSLQHPDAKLLWDKIRGSKVNINAQKDDRQKQRLAQNARSKAPSSS